MLARDLIYIILYFNKTGQGCLIQGLILPPWTDCVLSCPLTLKFSSTSRYLKTPFEFCFPQKSISCFTVKS